MWQVWLIIVIILLITSYRYHSYFLFYFFLASITTLVLSLFFHNLLLQSLFFILSALIFYFIPHNFFPIYPSYPILPIANSSCLIDQTGIVTRSLGSSLFQSGLVQINQDIWPAISASPIKEGCTVKVVSVQGVRLFVVPLSTQLHTTTKKDD